MPWFFSKNKGKFTIDHSLDLESVVIRPLDSPKPVNSSGDDAGSTGNIKSSTAEIPLPGQSPIPSPLPQPDNSSHDDEESTGTVKRRSGVIPLPDQYEYRIGKNLTKFPKSAVDKALIAEAINKNDFLSKVINGKRLEDIIDSMYHEDVRANQIIIKQGETGSRMFVSAKGEFQVFVEGEGLVNTIHEGQVFGEIAILYNAKRLATIKAKRSGKLWVLDRTAYHQLTTHSDVEEQEETLSFLKNVDKLNVVDAGALKEVSSLLKREFFSSGSIIVRQGESGDTFYIISAGTVTVSKENEGTVGNLKRGSFFGELALLEEITRQATVTADPPGAECLTLTRQQFMNYFGNVDDISSIMVLPQPPKVSIDTTVDAEYQDLDLHDFQILKTLGVGGFGRVEFIQHKKDPSLTFALKYLNKIEMVKQQQQQHVLNEKTFQMSCKSPFIIRLFRTFKDSKRIFFLMEVCLGGDLWYLLQKQEKKRFDEKGALFISGCVLEALGYLHERNIIYRDLKPENLVIDHRGYIKLTDFGFAKKLATNETTRTFAGTPEYVAPEIILNKGHDKAVDYWAFGILIFELLAGRTPFKTNDPSYMKTYNQILNGINMIEFPSHINSKPKHIIKKLCRSIPKERLGCQRSGIQEVKNDEWFAKFDWKLLQECKMKSPYKPKLKSNVDFTHIDKFKKETEVPADEISGWDIDF